MKSKAGICCDSVGFMNKYIDDCGVVSQPVTPQMLATPFFRGSFPALIIPTGFGNQKYSNLMPALKASAERIEKFVRHGGRVLCFGAMDFNEDAYCWLPFKCKYNHEYFGAPFLTTESAESEIYKQLGLFGFASDFDAEKIEYDGWFSDDESGNFTIAARTKDSNSRAVILVKKHGDGFYLATSVHELPSRAFIKNFCTGEDITF